MVASSAKRIFLREGVVQGWPRSGLCDANVKAKKKPTLLAHLLSTLISPPSPSNEQSHSWLSESFLEKYFARLARNSGKPSGGP